MRCIDADALRDRLQNLGYDDWNQGATTTWAEAFNECADMVDEQPTIEPQRKKGKWIDRGWSGDGRGNSWHEWECSECKHITKGAKWDFCPNCGADMQRGAV